MITAGFCTDAIKSNYDVIIIGGAMMGAATAWFLATNPDFDGSVLVIEKDPSYQFCSTSHTNSCIRQQFSAPLNVQISQFGAAFINNLRSFMGHDIRVPNIAIQSYGYMYLADTPAFATHLRQSQIMQAAAGAGTVIMTPDEIAKAYPFYNLDGILLGSINRVNEGYWDYMAVFDNWRRQAREQGVEFVAGQVVAMTKNASGTRIDSVTLQSGQVISCGHVVNATGPRATLTSRMAGIELPVEPRKRYTYIFDAEAPLDQELPLTIDPSGVHMRQDGRNTYLAGGHAAIDPAADPDDFTMDHALWQDHIWPAVAARIPQFEAIKVIREWVGHYAYNTFDHNAITGPHPEVGNFILLNGFSGHGLQQSPAMGRGTAEWLIYGAYRSLDLRPFHYDRITRGEPFQEQAII